MPILHCPIFPSLFLFLYFTVSSVHCSLSTVTVGLLESCPCLTGRPCNDGGHQQQDCSFLDDNEESN